ncbi:hypothetical protein NITHO_5240007 [Nitrolancea hollandica Lb]|uniref:Uncharacterized protein n=1 Tax=Nitrolancea hollandica Lb TaxID=1129897 RepID=I4ELQ8_9BACT|nr:hypothetical protein NITHO_5240007 [Nitrolancea hollandica Lb]
MSARWHISRSSMSNSDLRHPSAGSDSDGGGPAELRRRREAQIAVLSDEEFAAEVRQPQASVWRQPSLRSHARKHWGDFEEFLGHGLAPSDLDELSRIVLHSWNRLFTELDSNDVISYFFVACLGNDDDILVVVTRRGLIRTAFPADNVDLWRHRRKSVMEVTHRAKALEL